MITKEQKKKVVEELKDKVARQKAMVFVDFTGLKVKELSLLRKKLKAGQGELKVAKKTLMSLALKDYNPEVSDILKEMPREIALVFGYQDEMSPAKTLWQFSKDNLNLKILGSILESQKNAFLTDLETIELAKLPGREELLARLVGSIQAPISNFVYALQYNLKGLIQILTKLKV